MGNGRAGKHFRQADLDTSVGQGARRGGGLRRALVAVLALIGAVTVVVLVMGVINTPRYHTLEDIWDDYREQEGKNIDEEIKEAINNELAEKNIAIEISDVSTSASGNDITYTYTLPRDCPLATQYLLQLSSQSEDVTDEAVKAILTLKNDLEEDHITLDSDVRIISVFMIDSGDEVARATFTEDGLQSFSGEEISIAFEDIWNDRLFSESRAELEAQSASIAEEFEPYFPGSESWVEFHGNEIEFVVRLNGQRDEINVEAINEDLYSEEAASRQGDNIRSTMDLLREDGIEIGDITIRRTFRDASDNVLATCSYSGSGIVDDQELT